MLGKFPAPGSRHAYYGTSYHLGQGGYSYSSSVDGGYARSLNFYNSGITPQLTAYRADGFQVRCLLE